MAKEDEGQALALRKDDEGQALALRADGRFAERAICQTNTDI